MLPSLLLAAAFAASVELTAILPGGYVPVRVGSTVPWQYAIDVWGDPPHLRNYQWKYGTPSVWKNGQWQPATSISEAERIKQIEKALELLKKLGPPSGDEE